MRLDYKPKEEALFDELWDSNIKNVNSLDKYQYFDSYLETMFKTVCHFGYIEVELKEIDIPLER